MSERFPIMEGGPSVPWEVMEPHEAQAQRNHGQSLLRLAQRGGLAPEEAWAVVNDIKYEDIPDDAKERWRKFANETNERYRFLSTEATRRLHSDLETLRQQNAELVKERDASITALKRIKHYCLTTKEYSLVKILSHFVRVCIDAGIKQSYEEIEKELKL